MSVAHDSSQEVTSPELDESEQELRELIEAEPGRSDLWYSLGVHLKSKGENVEAEAAFERAIELNQHDPRPWAQLCFLYTTLNRREEAAHAYQRLQRSSHGNLVDDALDRPEPSELWFDDTGKSLLAIRDFMYFHRDKDQGGS